MSIEIILHSPDLIKKYLQVCDNHSFIYLNSINLQTLLTWLNEEQAFSVKTKKKQKEIELLMASFHASLLNDLAVFMGGFEANLEKGTNNSSKSKSKIKLMLLTTAGILVAACQGFDGMVTMLSIFSIPSFILLVAGASFSLFSIVVFCGVDLVKLANDLGVKLTDTCKLLDACLVQLQSIKEIRKKVSNLNLGELALDELICLAQILGLLQTRYLSLIKSSKQFDDALHSQKMQIIKYLMTGISGLLFFGEGFFAGQSVALFVASLINVTVPAFLPVILFSTLVGIAALSLYWYVERPELNQLVSSWFGLDEENVEKLCSQELLVKENKKIENLQQKVSSMIKITQRFKETNQDEDTKKDDDSKHQGKFLFFKTKSITSIEPDNLEVKYLKYV